MLRDQENQIFPKAEKSRENLEESIRLFETFLHDGASTATGDYYRARNLVKEGEGAYKEAVANARKLLGELPQYATDDYRRWREEFLRRHNILAQGREYEDCRRELSRDDFINRIMTAEEIDALLNLHFHSQQQGKRKLPHIKVRMVLDKLSEMLIHAKELQKQASVKLQRPS
jgi:hypothetical protein